MPDRDDDSERPRRRGPYAKTAERRQQIVDEAYRVFATRGYRGSSLREIAAAAGIGLSTLQHHFGGKEDLLVAVLARRDELGGDPDAIGGVGVVGGVGFAGGVGRTPFDGLTFADRITAQAERNERVPGLIALYSVLAAEAADTEHPAHGYFLDRYTTMRETYHSEFTALAEAGRLRAGVDPALAAATVVALWEGIQLQWLYSPERTHAAEALRGYLELVIMPRPVRNAAAADAAR